jgi:hypothetical protein
MVKKYRWERPAPFDARQPTLVFFFFKMESKAPASASVPTSAWEVGGLLSHNSVAQESVRLSFTLEY